MIITLCGSTRFINSFHSYDLHLTLCGHTVFTVATSVKGFWQPTATEKKVLDLVHLSKIEISDAIFVIDREFGLEGELPPYVGDSTLNEIRYAAIRNKLIFWASKHDARKLLLEAHDLSMEMFSHGFSEVFSRGLNKANDRSS